MRRVPVPAGPASRLAARALARVAAGVLSALLTVPLAACTGPAGAAAPDGSPPPSAPSSAGSGSSVAPTVQSPVPSELEPAPEGLEPLVPGHNRASADRINLVLAPFGWDDPEEFRAVAAMFVDWSGHAQVWDSLGRPLAADANPALGVWADLGLFGYEPFRSRRDLVNVWVTDESPDDAYEWNYPENSPVWLPDQVIVVLAVRDPSTGEGGSVSGSFDGPTGPDALVRDTDRPFANATVSVWSSYPAMTIRDLPHELGHALFGLADEYVGRQSGYDGWPRNPFWPSCADSLERATSWWADDLGTYDAQLDYWAEQTAAVGFGPSAAELDQLEEQNTTAYVEGGCFGVPGSYRSADDTLMGFNLPAYGVTNRRWAAQVLDLWTGD